jgi:predicted ATP-dependent serine protease
VQIKDESRLKTGIAELDRVLGGGIVKGSVILIGGDPGVGKSTISLQVSNQLTHKGAKVLYISGEESVNQTKMRAKRLGALDSDSLYIVNQTDLSNCNCFTITKSNLRFAILFFKASYSSMSSSCFPITEFKYIFAAFSDVLRISNSINSRLSFNMNSPLSFAS